MSVTIWFQGRTQHVNAPRFYRPEFIAPKIDSLQKLYPKIKIFTKDTLAIWNAILHYPELKDIKIIVRYKKLKTSLAARPIGLQVLRSKRKREYTIFVNNDASAKVPMDSASYNAKVGVYGHELAHILDYTDKSSWQMMRIGLRYSNKKFRSKMERGTDLIAIRHGLLWQCYDWSFFVYHYHSTPKEYLEYKDEIYMKYDEMEELSE